MPPSNPDWFGPHDDTGQNWHECAPRVPGAAHGAPVTGEERTPRLMVGNAAGARRATPAEAAGLRRREETAPVLYFDFSPLAERLVAAFSHLPSADVEAAETDVEPSLADALSPPFPPPASWRPDPLSPAIFIAMLNRLRSLRIGELCQAGVWRGIPQPQLGREYHLFRSNPADYLLRADNATRDRIWRLLVAGAAT